MISIPVHNFDGKQVDQLEIDEQLLGGRVRPILLKQAYVRFHANRRQGSAATRNRSRIEGSTRKLYKQKGTGNARHGPAGANLMRGGGHAHAKQHKSWRQRIPDKMRRLANRNALLAKAVDGEIKLIDQLKFEAPSTKQFSQLLKNLGIDRTCLVAVADTRGNESRSTANLEHVSLTQIDRLNAFDVLNHRYLLADKQALEGWIRRTQVKTPSSSSEEKG